MLDRNNLIWVTTRGDKISVAKMTTNHLVNAIDKLEDKRSDQFLNGMFVRDWLFQMKKEVCRRYSGTFSVPAKKRA